MDGRIQAMQSWVSWDSCCAGRRVRQTRYQPVGLPVSPIFECDVRTKRTRGCAIVMFRRVDWCQMDYLQMGEDVVIISRRQDNRLAE